VPDTQWMINSYAGTIGANGEPLLDAQGAANVWAGTTGLDLLGALNKIAGTTGLGYNAAISRIMGSSLDGQGALITGSPPSGGGATPGTYTTNYTTTYP